MKKFLKKVVKSKLGKAALLVGGTMIGAPMLGKLAAGVGAAGAGAAAATGAGTASTIGAKLASGAIAGAKTGAVIGGVKGLAGGGGIKGAAKGALKGAVKGGITGGIGNAALAGIQGMAGGVTGGGGGIGSVLGPAAAKIGGALSGGIGKAALVAGGAALAGKAIAKAANPPAPAAPAGPTPEQLEAQRQARIRAATDSINGLFKGRDGMYGNLRRDVFQMNKLELDRTAQEAARENKFGLMRNGLIGSSVQVESEADLNRRTNEGLLRVGSTADQAANDLRMADERTRSNLIGLAQSGVDSTTAQQQALTGLSLNAEQAKNQRTAANIGGLFDGIGQAYMYRQAYGDGTGMFGRGGFAGPSRRYQGMQS